MVIPSALASKRRGGRREGEGDLAAKGTGG